HHHPPRSHAGSPRRERRAHPRVRLRSPSRRRPRRYREEVVSSAINVAWTPRRWPDRPDLLMLRAVSRLLALASLSLGLAMPAAAQGPPPIRDDAFVRAD